MNARAPLTRLPPPQLLTAPRARRLLLLLALSLSTLAPATAHADEEIADPDDDDGWLPPSGDTSAVAPAASSGPVEPATTVRATAMVRLALDTGHEGARPDQKGDFHEDVMALYAQASAHLKHRVSSRLRLQLGCRLEYRLTARQPTVDETYNLFNGDIHRSDFAVVPADSYIGASLWWLDLRAGMITEVWGAANLVNPNDVLTARDLLDGPPVDPEVARSPRPMLVAQAFVLGFTASVAWLPVFLPDRMEAFGSDYSMLGPASLPQLRVLGEMADGLVDDSVKGVVQPALLQTHLPRPLRDSSLAFRLERSVAGWDLSLMYGYLFQRQPHIRLRTYLLPMVSGGASATLDPALLGTLAGALLAQGMPLETKYRRYHHAGLSVTRTWWKLLLSLDVSYASARGAALAEIPKSAPGDWFSPSLESQALSYTVGATWTHGEAWMVNLEWWHTALLDLLADHTPELLLGGPHQAGPALLVRYHNDTINLSVQVGAVTDLLNPSLLLTAQVSYRVWDHLGVFVGVNLFEGQERSAGGRFDVNDQVFVGVQGYL